MIIYQRFEWDVREAARNLTSHGVGFKEASTILSDETHTVVPEGGSRLLAVGRSDRGRSLAVVHEIGQRDVGQSLPRIRILGAERYVPKPAAPAPPASTAKPASRSRPSALEAEPASQPQPVASQPAASQPQPAASQPPASQSQPRASQSEPPASKSKPASRAKSAPKAEPSAPKAEPSAPKAEPSAPKAEPSAPKAESPTRKAEPPASTPELTASKPEPTAPKPRSRASKSAPPVVLVEASAPDTSGQTSSKREPRPGSWKAAARIFAERLAAEERARAGD
jgi:uncharacterized DUF497 family protein